MTAVGGVKPCRFLLMAYDRKLRHRVDTFTLKACIDSQQRELAKVEPLAAGHRADFERRAEQQLLAEPFKAPADTTAAKELTTRLENELAAQRSRPWWRRQVG